MSRRLAFPVIVVAASLLAACGKGSAPPPAVAPDKTSNATAAAPTLLISGEDLRTIAQTARAEGPVVTGSVQPERRADLRAEVSSVVLQVLKENGDVVKRGDVLVKLDETAIRDSLSSAEASARAAAQALDQ